LSRGREKKERPRTILQGKKNVRPTSVSNTGELEKNGAAYNTPCGREEGAPNFITKRRGNAQKNFSGTTRKGKGTGQVLLLPIKGKKGGTTRKPCPQQQREKKKARITTAPRKPAVSVQLNE